MKVIEWLSLVFSDWQTHSSSNRNEERPSRQRRAFRYFLTQEVIEPLSELMQIDFNGGSFISKDTLSLTSFSIESTDIPQLL